MPKYVLMRIPATKAPQETEVYQGENNKWVYTKAKAKIFTHEVFIQPCRKYRYRYVKISE